MQENHTGGKFNLMMRCSASGYFPVDLTQTSCAGIRIAVECRKKGYFMREIRVATLAIGASLLGSSLAIIFDTPSIPIYILLAAGILFTLIGSGFAQHVTREALIKYRLLFPAIGIISDLPWDNESPEKKTHMWAWPQMNPKEWRRRVLEEASKNGVRIKVKHIKIHHIHTRSFLERYNAIINPYGSVYPEIDTKEMLVWNAIQRYVRNEGLFVNIADIPLYWVYDLNTDALYDSVKRTYQYVPLEFVRSGESLKLKHTSLEGIAPFAETLFLGDVKVQVINMEQLKGSASVPRYPLELREDHFGGCSLGIAALHRAFEIHQGEKGRVQSVVKEIEHGGYLLSPICFVDFGKGKFLISLPFLDGEDQTDSIKERITWLQCALVIKKVANRKLIGGRRMSEKKKERGANTANKRLNGNINIITIFWVIIMALFGIGIGFPAAAGNLGIIMGIGNDPNVITGNIPLHAGESIGLAVLAAALSGIVTWLGRPNIGTKSEGSQDNLENRMMRHLGISFLFAAFCFTLFAGLSQLIPEVRDRPDLWSKAIRYSAGIFVLGGSIFLSFSALWGLLEIVRRGLCALLASIAKKPVQQDSKPEPKETGEK